MVLRDREVFVATFSDGKRETEGSSPFVVIAHGCSIMSGSPRASARVGEPATFYRVATTAYRHCYLYPPPPPPFSVSYSTYVPRFIHALASLTCPRGSWVAVLSLSLFLSLSRDGSALCNLVSYTIVPRLQTRTRSIPLRVLRVWLFVFPLCSAVVWCVRVLGEFCGSPIRVLWEFYKNSIRVLSKSYCVPR